MKYLETKRGRYLVLTCRQLSAVSGSKVHSNSTINYHNTSLGSQLYSCESSVFPGILLLISFSLQKCCVRVSSAIVGQIFLKFGGWVGTEVKNSTI